MNAFDNGDIRTTVLIMGALQARDYKGVGNQYVQEGKLIMDIGVRRLTPVECERLQGFPDNWTEGQSDSARYKQMGNAVAVPVVEWIIGNICDTLKTAE
jgi:DNA (cytosine-5)-methyltransferase 1